MNIPEISLPDFSTADLREAASVLESCRKPPLPEHGFPCPFIAPGGYYGNMWWLLDFTLALTGLRWLEPEFAKQSIRNFESCQKPDGRLPLWGNDRLPDFNGERLQRTDTSSLPKLFDAVFKIARSSRDEDFIRRCETLTSRYLDWWIRNRKDPETGLFSAVFEETFIPYYGFAGEYAPPDLNAEMLHGFFSCAGLARQTGQEEKAESLLEQAEELRRAVSRQLWDEETGFFLPLLLREKKHCRTKMVGAFAALRHKAADSAQRDALIRILRSPGHFGWGERGLTSVDRTDPAFTAYTGKYCGNPCWSGGIWSILNENAVRGLYDCGEYELAGELAAHTLSLFRKRYCEFMNPDTGEPSGVPDYAWTAAQCIDMLFSVIFGIDCCAWDGTVTVRPAVPDQWRGREIALRDLLLPENARLNLVIRCGPEAAIGAEIISADGTASRSRGNGKLVLRIP